VNPIPEHLWKLTGWEGSRREQLRRWRALTLREKLRAVEEVAELSAKLAGARARRRRRS
jgi:hypothetical protein